MLNLNELDKNALSDEELVDVTGGKNDKNINKNGNNQVTKMKCKFCGFPVTFAGNFEDKTFECKKCHRKNALEAVKD